MLHCRECYGHLLRARRGRNRNVVSGYTFVIDDFVSGYTFVIDDFVSGYTFFIDYFVSGYTFVIGDRHLKSSSSFSQS